MLAKIENEVDSITLFEAMEYSGYSRFHFCRIFLAYTGESLASYIKRLKMQKAARKIQYHKESVTEIALDAGYATHSAFCVAFKEMFGVSPSEFKAEKIRNVEEFIMLEPEFITVEPIDVLAVRHIGAYSACGEAWEKLMQFAYTQKIKHKKNLVGKNTRIFGVGYDDPRTTEETKLRYDACITKDDDVVLEEGIKEMTIEGGKCARFLHKGSYEGLADTYNQIFGGWVLKNNIELRDAPPFEEYLNRDPRRTKPENLRTLIYIPIR